MHHHHAHANTESPPRSRAHASAAPSDSQRSRPSKGGAGSSVLAKASGANSKVWSSQRPTHNPPIKQKQQESGMGAPAAARAHKPERRLKSAAAKASFGAAAAKMGLESASDHLSAAMPRAGSSAASSQ